MQSCAAARCACCRAAPGDAPVPSPSKCRPRRQRHSDLSRPRRPTLGPAGRETLRLGGAFSAGLGGGLGAGRGARVWWGAGRGRNRQVACGRLWPPVAEERLDSRSRAQRLREGLARVQGSLKVEVGALEKKRLVLLASSMASHGAVRIVARLPNSRMRTQIERKVNVSTSSRGF